MWTRRVMAALLTAPLLLTGVLPTAQASPDPKLTVTAVSLSRSSVVVSGLNLVPVTVTVKGGYDSTNPADEQLTLFVVLERTSGSGQYPYQLSTNLPRTAGTVKNGTWSGPLYVPSTANGTWKVTGVRAGPYGIPGDMTDPTPFAGPALAVSGSHLPKLNALVTPRVVPFGSPYTIKWAITDSATGKPYGTRLTALLAIDNGCAEDAGGDVIRTDVNGLYTKQYRAADADSLNCLRITGKPVDIAGLGFAVARPGIVAATPSRTSASVGTVVPVNGSVAGAPAGCPVGLQRLYGATRWRAVSAAKVRQSGRFTVNAQPAYKGLIPYRVYLPACHRFQAGVSKVFYIRGL
ncbi:hypothetical protein E1218_03035 [Kribbella turkmenica]|uniref:Uncharacterized protein n=1 Tax=Kribbella turkmenica TaxID=2530375 RepID=A0A4R4XGI3_9ACTN|nr:hypothetical protein [Kribbella turkmenica]TDD29933.1 hypothetical protein E1218_03035 [Kribbella turkmenica]